MNPRPKIQLGRNCQGFQVVTHAVFGAAQKPKHHTVDSEAWYWHGMLTDPTRPPHQSQTPPPRKQLVAQFRYDGESSGGAMDPLLDTTLEAYVCYWYPVCFSHVGAGPPHRQLSGDPCPGWHRLSHVCIMPLRTPVREVQPLP